jgi:hypothetical protein
MSIDPFDEKAPRHFEKFCGAGVLIISFIFIALASFSFIATLQNSKVSIGTLFFQFNLILIGIFFGNIALKLIKGLGVNKSDYLLSDFSMLIWGTVFGVAGIIELGMGVTSADYYYVMIGVGSIMMGLSSYGLVKKRRHRR